MGCATVFTLSVRAELAIKPCAASAANAGPKVSANPQYRRVILDRRPPSSSTSRCAWPVYVLFIPCSMQRPLLWAPRLRQISGPPVTPYLPEMDDSAAPTWIAWVNAGRPDQAATTRYTYMVSTSWSEFPSPCPRPHSRLPPVFRRSVEHLHSLNLVLQPFRSS